MILPTSKQRGKHYQCQRAKADGWGIEMLLHSVNSWVGLSSPSFIDSCEYRIVPDENGWLPWYATEDRVCPVEHSLVIDVLWGMKDLTISTHEAGGISWGACAHSVTHYRPRKERKLVKTVKHYDDGTIEED